ncbi:hypothetical protein E2C01_081973 [Portunus trituberculatus]|uniref:Uncharacterized protein n=1 Tax=Portunus trituberculatus TaxID=210409 RepID=A0A5B7IT96_PORTR|nr:hypothetical protein [Portunus trituberculatus]
MLVGGQRWRLGAECKGGGESCDVRRASGLMQTAAGTWMQPTVYTPTTQISYVLLATTNIYSATDTKSCSEEWRDVVAEGRAGMEAQRNIGMVLSRSLCSTSSHVTDV